MKATVFFYRCKYTKFNRVLLEEMLNALEIELVSWHESVSPHDFVVKLSKEVKNCHLIIILGGLKNEDDFNIKRVLSRVIGYPLIKIFSEENCVDNLMLKHSKIVNGMDIEHEDGYTLTKDWQTICLLPSSPSEVKWFTQNTLKERILNIYPRIKKAI